MPQDPDNTSYPYWSPDSRFLLFSIRDVGWPPPSCWQIRDPVTGAEVQLPLKAGQKIVGPWGNAYGGGGAWVGPAGSRVLLERRQAPDAERADVSVWDVAAGQVVLDEVSMEGSVQSAAFSADLRRFLLVANRQGGPGQVQVHDVATGKAAGPFLIHDKAVQSAEFSPDGGRVATTEYNSLRALVWDVERGAGAVEPLQHVAVVCGAWFSPDGTRLLTWAADQTARVWDSRSGKPLTPPMECGEQYGAAPRFSPDGRLVLTCGGNSVRVWDAESGEPVTPSMPDDSRSSAFNRSGDRVVTNAMIAAKVWNLTPEPHPTADLLRLAQLLAARRIDSTGGYVPLDQAQSREHWDSLRTRYPRSEFQLRPEQRRAWQLAAVSQCDEQGKIFYLDQLIAERPTGVLYEKRGRAREKLSQWSLAVADYSRAIDAGNDRREIRQGRGEAHAQLGHWREAAEDFERALDPEQVPALDALLWEKVGVCLLAAGRVEEYSRLCERLAAAEVKSGYVTRKESWIFVLSPGARGIDRMLPLIEEMVTHPYAEPSDLLLVLGAMLYRQGQYEAALVRLKKQGVAARGKEGPTPWDSLFLAMICHRLGQKEEARQWLQKAIDAARAQTEGAASPDWVKKQELELLLREAESVVQGKGP